MSRGNEENYERSKKGKLYSVVRNLLNCKFEERPGSDLRSKDNWSKAHQRHCVVSLSKTLYPLLNTSSTQEDRKLPQYD